MLWNLLKDKPVQFTAFFHESSTSIDSQEVQPLNTTMQTLGFLPNLGWPEMLIIGIIMLLLFGRRLPEVGRSLGQGIVSFKKGLKEVGDEINVQSDDNVYQPKFDSAKAPNNPDMSSSAHSSSNIQSEPVETPKSDSNS